VLLEVLEMAGTNIGQMLTTPGKPAASRRAQSHQGMGRYLDHKGASNSEQKIEKKAGTSQSGFSLSLIVVIEQWICLLLGIICMVSGALGISMSLGQHDLHAHLACAGLGYVPLLRITAATCLALGIVLVHLGWTSRRSQSAGGSHMQIVKEEADEKRC
jgi:hypothetical protein